MSTSKTRKRMTKSEGGDVPSSEQIKQILKDMRKNEKISVTHIDGTKCEHIDICDDAKIIMKEDEE